MSFKESRSKKRDALKIMSGRIETRPLLVQFLSGFLKGVPRGTLVKSQAPKKAEIIFVEKPVLFVFLKRTKVAVISNAVRKSSRVRATADRKVR